MWQAKLTALALAAAALLSGCASTEGSSAMLIDGTLEAQTANYRTSIAQQGDLIKTSQLSLEPIYYLSQTLYCPEDGLYFDGFAVSRGDLVKEGELIASFTRKGSQAELEQARLALERAREQRETGQARLESALTQARSRGAAYEELARIDLDQYIYNSDLELAALEQELARVEASFENEYVYAPFDCVIHSLQSLDQGALVDEGRELAQLKDAGSLLLFSTTSAKNFLYNMDVTVEYGRQESRQTVAARVVANDAVLPSGVAGDGYTYFKVDGALTEDELYKPTASVTTVQAKDALLVPRGAVEVEDGHYYVSVLEGEMVKKRYIIRGITGGTVGESCTVILAGVRSGQTVILD